MSKKHHPKDIEQLLTDQTAVILEAVDTRLATQDKRLDRRFATQNRRIYGVERKVDKSGQDKRARDFKRTHKSAQFLKPTIFRANAKFEKNAFAGVFNQYRGFRTISRMFCRKRNGSFLAAKLQNGAIWTRVERQRFRPDSQGSNLRLLNPGGDRV